MLSSYIRTDDIELLYAKAYKKQRKFEKAISHCRNAINLFPSKYAQRYELMLIYRDCLKNDTKGIEIVSQIIYMPEKIPNGRSLFIRRQADKYIKSVMMADSIVGESE